MINFLWLGYIFLYVPLFFLTLFSFNGSPISGIWTGFSLRWYKVLLQNDALLHALWVSLKVAFFSASFAIILGTTAALAMTRIKKFKNRSLFESLLALPLITPEVIIGLALLLTFVTFENAMGWPGQRGILTVVIGHTTVGMAYVYFIVHTRLKDFDLRFEESALDLGARPKTVFTHITLPLIAPSLLAGWFLAFSLSLDDVVLASFLSGPGGTTFPVLIFSSIRLGLTPETNAIATVIIGTMSFMLGLIGIFLFRRIKTA